MYLVDVSSMFFRAYYAIRPLTSPSGLPVNAIYGFVSMIVKLLKEEKPDYFVFCYDRKEPSFRKEIYPEYKAHRTEMPEDLGKQIPYIKKIADLLGIPSLEISPYEADDIIGTLAKFGREKNLEVVIVSGDKDFGQLITNHVVLYDTMKDHKYDSLGVKEKWGIPPEQFIDYLALVGDTSDNIPGVEGIGPKGAQKLLQDFGSLESIYANIDKISSASIKQKLIQSKENAFLSKQLVTIALNVPIDNDLNSYKMRPIQTKELRELLRELNFKTIEQNLLGSDGNNSTSMTAASSDHQSNSSSMDKTANVHTESGVAENDLEILNCSMQEFIKKIHEYEPLWGFLTDRGVIISNQKVIYAIHDMDHRLGELCDQKKVKWSGFDLKSFWHVIGCRSPQAEWDSQLAAYVIKAGNIDSFQEAYSMHTHLLLPDFPSNSQMLHAHIQLKKILQKKLKEIEGEKIYNDFELPLSEVLLDIENSGVLIDKEALHHQSKDLTRDISSLEKKIHEAAGEHFNVASPKQLAQVLFTKLGIEPIKKTKTGYSTDNEVLKKIDHPISKLVLEYRELSKLKSTYVDALPGLISEVDGRVHTRFNQALTMTGRLSSTHPNLQNIPIKTSRGQMVRKAFIAPEGQCLLSVDYSQIELRILAHISEDENMCNAFKHDLDIHAATASEIFSVDLKSVTSEQRRTAKAVNFGIAYGQGAFGLAESLSISRKDAQDIIEKYFTKFKNIRVYMEETVKKAHERGYVETLFGRRRYIDELKSKNQALKKFGERAAINAPIQGTASDLMKIAMIKLHKTIPLKMILQVHDELLFEGSEHEIKLHVSEIVKILEGVVQLRVPLKVNYAIGKNWDEAH